jgi:UPF0716 protein FxsA
MIEMWPLVALIAVPVVELMTIIQVGRWIGTFPTIGLLFLSGMIGLSLVRAGGLHSLAQAQTVMRGLRGPSPGLVRGAFWMASGVLFMIPGFLSDVLGLFLLLPVVQSAVVKRLAPNVTVSGASWTTHTPAQNRSGTVIEGEYHEVEQGPPKGDGGSGWTRH